MKKYGILALGLILFSGCVNQPSLVADNSFTRTKAGSLLGALTGAVIGYNSGNHHNKKGAVLGAVAGAVAGGSVGYLLDKQANEVANALGTGVANDPLAAKDPNKTIVVMKYPDHVRVLFRDKMMFATNSATLQPSARAKVLKLASVLRQYPKTVVGVAGFTDNRGSYSYNQKLSLNRAASVARLLTINGKRPKIKGCSYNKPLVPNNSPQNMAINRRVEVYLYNDPSRMTDPCR
jgi:outer membrane protein OmpA-like peptidoglycan-associated protein